MSSPSYPVADKRPATSLTKKSLVCGGLRYVYFVVPEELGHLCRGVHHPEGKPRPPLFYCQRVMGGVGKTDYLAIARERPWNMGVEAFDHLVWVESKQPTRAQGRLFPSLFTERAGRQYVDYLERGAGGEFAHEENLPSFAYDYSLAPYKGGGRAACVYIDDTRDAPLAEVKEGARQ